MVTLNYKHVDAQIIGKDHGLNVEKEFDNPIAMIENELNQFAAEEWDEDFLSGCLQVFLKHL